MTHRAARIRALPIMLVVSLVLFAMARPQSQPVVAELSHPQPAEPEAVGIVETSAIELEPPRLDALLALERGPATSQAQVAAPSSPFVPVPIIGQAKSGTESAPSSNYDGTRIAFWSTSNFLASLSREAVVINAQVAINRGFGLLLCGAVQPQ
jgi:hypothetical protein